MAGPNRPAGAICSTLPAGTTRPGGGLRRGRRTMPAAGRRRGGHVRRWRVIAAPPAGHARPGRGRAPARTGRRRVADPAATVGVPRLVHIPRAIDVIAVPVVGRREGDHRNADSGEPKIGHHLDPALGRLISEIFAVDPAAIAVPGDVAPRLVLQAALDVERRALGDDAQRGKLRIGPGADVYVRGGETRRLRVRRPADARHRQAGCKAGQSQHLHGPLPFDSGESSGQSKRPRMAFHVRRQGHSRARARPNCVTIW